MHGEPELPEGVQADDFRLVTFTPYKVFPPLAKLIHRFDIRQIVGNVPVPVVFIKASLQGLPILAGQYFEGESLARLKMEAGGVGNLLGKVVLVDVDADAGDGVLQRVASEMMLDEDAGNLLPLDVDVVGPLDSNFRQVLEQKLARGDSKVLVEEELPGGAGPGGEIDRQQHVLAALAEPFVGSHPMPIFLKIGKYGRERRQRRAPRDALCRLLRQPLVGGRNVRYELQNRVNHNLVTNDGAKIENFQRVFVLTGRIISVKIISLPPNFLKMKKLKIFSALVLAFMLFSACEDDSNTYVNQLYTNSQKIQAITTCLNSSVDTAVTHLCTYDGFYNYKDGLYRIDFANLQSSIFDTLAHHNYGYMTDSLILRANRLAESCASNASSAFKDAVSDLDIEDPDKLFYGESGSITDYFKFMEYDNIKSDLQAPVSIRMDLFNVSTIWMEMLEIYRQYNPTPVTVDLQDQIVIGMMDGIFEEMRLEEDLIRTDSTHRTEGDSILVR